MFGLQNPLSFLEKKTFYFSILAIWTNTDGKAHVLHKNNWLVNAKKCLDKVYLIDPRWDIKVITSNILWVILYVILYSFSHKLPIHKHPLYTLSHRHQYTALLQSLGAFGLVVFQNWNDDMKREFGFSCRSHEWCLVNEGGQGDVPLGQTSTLVCAERDLDLLREWLGCLWCWNEYSPTT